VNTSLPMASASEPSPVQKAVRIECARLEEDALYSARGHFEAARTWGRVHLLIGIPSSAIAALAGISAFNELPEVAGALAVLVAALTAVSTFLNPSEKSQSFHAAGAAFNAVRSRARFLREVTSLTDTPDSDLAAQLAELTGQKDDLNQQSPPIPRGAFERARKGIEAGEASYRADEAPKRIGDTTA
jgi:hypothetical protein